MTDEAKRAWVTIEPDALWAFLWWATGAALIVLLLVVPLVKVASADGRADFCFVAKGDTGPYFYVQAHRPWRPDTTIAQTQTLMEAVEAARAVNCPLHTEATP